MQIFSANRHDVEILTSGVISCQRCVIEKTLFFGFFGTFRAMEDKVNTPRSCRATVIFLGRLLRAVVNGVQFGECIWPQYRGLQNVIFIICRKKYGFSQFSHNGRGITLREHQKSIPRPILGGETFSFC